mmetsp:Transcript_29777/g.72559  ORF Transcript_29777/g.72559 Transcript_29777/m.72559 type:complete len:833 (-) Transcript_29777:101-2599(-)
MSLADFAATNVLDALRDELEGAYLVADAAAGEFLSSCVGLSSLLSSFRVHTVLPLEGGGKDTKLTSLLDTVSGSHLESSVRSLLGKKVVGNSSEPPRPRLVFFISSCPLKRAGEIARKIVETRAGAVLVVCSAVDVDVDVDAGTAGEDGGKEEKQLDGVAAGDAAASRNSGGSRGNGRDMGAQAAINSGEGHEIPRGDRRRPGGGRPEGSGVDPLKKKRPAAAADRLETIKRAILARMQQRKERKEGGGFSAESKSGSATLRPEDIVLRVRQLPISFYDHGGCVFTVPPRQGTFPLVFEDLLEKKDRASEKVRAATDRGYHQDAGTRGNDQGITSKKSRRFKKRRGVASILNSLDKVKGFEGDKKASELRMLAMDLALGIRTMLNDSQPKCFTAGDTSLLVARTVQQKIEELNSEDGKKGDREQKKRKRVTLVLVDRTLDLHSVCKHEKPNALDELHRQIDEERNRSVETESANGHSVIEDRYRSVSRARTQLPADLDLPNTLSEAKHALASLQSQGSTAPKRKTKVTGLQLQRMLSRMPSNVKARNLSLIKASEVFANIAIKNKKNRRTSRSKKIEATERLILTTASIPDLRSGLMAQIVDILDSVHMHNDDGSDEGKNTRDEDGVGLDDAFTLAALAFSIGGPDVSYEELVRFDTAINRALMRASSLSSLRSLAPAYSKLSLSLELVPEDVTDRLLDVAAARSSVLASNLRNPTPSGEGLMLQLLKNILQGEGKGVNFVPPPSKGVVEGISSITSFLGNIGFTKQAKAPNAVDCDILVFFVIGGITFEEACALKKFVIQAQNESQIGVPNVLIGSTGIATSHSVLKGLLQ